MTNFLYRRKISLWSRKMLKLCAEIDKDASREAIIRHLEENMKTLIALESEIKKAELTSKMTKYEKSGEKKLEECLSPDNEKLFTQYSQHETEEKTSKENEETPVVDNRMKSLQHIILIKYPSLITCQQLQDDEADTSKDDNDSNCTGFLDKNVDEIEISELEMKNQLLEQKKNHREDLLREFREHEEKRQESYSAFLKEKYLIEGIIKNIILEDDIQESKRREEQKLNGKMVFDGMENRTEVFEEKGLKKVNDVIIVEGLAAVNDENGSTKETEGQLHTDRVAKENKAEDIKKKRIEAMIRKILISINKFEEEMKDKYSNEEVKKRIFENFLITLIAKLSEEDRLEFYELEAREKIEQRCPECFSHKENVFKDMHSMEKLEIWRNRMIGEIKAEILDEYAFNVLGYLPRNVFCNVSEIEKMGDAYRTFYQKAFDSDQNECEASDTCKINPE